MNKYAFTDRKGAAHEFPEITGETFLRLRGAKGLPDAIGAEFLVACAMQFPVFVAVAELLAGAKAADMLAPHIEAARVAWMERVADFYQGQVGLEMLTGILRAADVNAYLAQLVALAPSLAGAIGGSESLPVTEGLPMPTGETSVSVS